MTVFTFKYPKGPSSVLVTGAYDGWASQTPLLESDAGFEISLPLAGPTEFKFIVDGEWVTSDLYETATDESGNVNNIATPAVTEAAAGAAIPEAGGLVSPVQAPAQAEAEPEVPAKPAKDISDDDPKSDPVVSGATSESTASAGAASAGSSVKYVKRVKKTTLKSKLKQLFS